MTHSFMNQSTIIRMYSTLESKFHNKLIFKGIVIFFKVILDERFNNLGDITIDYSTHRYKHSP